MKNKVWGVNVIGNQGVNADNDFVIGASDDGKDVVVKINNTEITGAEFAVLKEIAEGGPTPGGNSNSNGFYHCTETMPDNTPEYKISNVEDGTYEHIYFNDTMIAFKDFGDLIVKNMSPEENGTYKITDLFSIEIDGDSKDAIQLFYAPVGIEFEGMGELDEELYYLTWMDHDMPIYISRDFGGLQAGWNTASIEKDFSYTLSVGEMYQIMPSMGYDWVKQIISTNNEWTTVPAKEATVDRDTIITGEKELAKGDVVLDASGNLATIKDFVGREVKHQHATNPFAIGDVVSMDGEDYAYFIDTNFDPSSFANLDWDNAYTHQDLPTIDLVQTDYEHPQLISVSYMDAETAHAPFKGRVFLLWSLDNDCLLYVQAEYPEDEQIIAAMMGVPANQWATVTWPQWSDIVLTDIGNGIYRALMRNGTGNANVTSVDGQNLISACITKDGQWTQDEPEVIPAVTYDKFAQVALKKDIPTSIDYANVKNVPIYAKQSLGDGEISVYDADYVISLDSTWSDKNGNNYEKGILYYADKNNNVFVPITGGGTSGGGTQLYKHAFSLQLGEGGTVQETWSFEIVNADATPVEDESSFVNILGEPMFYNGVTMAADGGDSVTCYIMGVFKKNGTPSAMRIDMGDISSMELNEFLPTVMTYGTDTVTEL